MKCELCNRNRQCTKHHLIPRMLHKRFKTKKNFKQEILNKTVDLCKECHHMVHDFFTEKELAEKFNSIDCLLSDEKVLKFIKWLNR